MLEQVDGDDANLRAHLRKQDDGELAVPVADKEHNVERVEGPGRGVVRAQEICRQRHQLLALRWSTRSLVPLG